jgi:hypothetical protein
MNRAAGMKLPAAPFCVAALVVIPGRALFGANPESRSIARLTSRFRVRRDRAARCANPLAPARNDGVAISR